LNIHASLLPRWRGAAPIQRAIEAGDAETGITLMQMDEGLDTGDIVAMQALPIGAHESAGQLHDRLAALGAQLVVQALQAAEAGPLPRRPQPAQGVTYAHKIDKAEAVLDWRQPAAVLARRVRAFDPTPGAVTVLDGAPLKVWRAQAEASPAASPTAPGTVVAVDDHGIRVQTGDGVLVLTEVQRAGGRRLPVRDFLRGAPLRAGVRLGEGA
jgi:methionyl-tRNA formyltransferase